MFRAGFYINRKSKFLPDFHSSCKSYKRKQTILYDCSSFQLLSSPFSISFFSSSNSWNTFDGIPDNPYKSQTGLLQLLNDEQRQLWDDQLQLKHQAKQVVAQLPKTNSNDKKRDELNNVVSSASNSNPLTFVEGIESTFSVVVTGEFNAGKSTVINALLGEELLESGALPTTDTITILTNPSTSVSSYLNSKHDSTTILPKDNSNNKKEKIKPPPGVTIIKPIEPISILRDVTIIDTPGTNTSLLDHTSKTLKLLPNADLILFVTSAERPMTQSEQKLIQSMIPYQKQMIVVLNKTDVLESLGPNYGEKHKEQMISFVKDQLGPSLGFQSAPTLFPISGRDALNAKKLENKQRTTNESSQTSSFSSSMWERSQFQSLEYYLKYTLTQQSKIRTKLLNPIQVTEGIITQTQNYLKYCQERLETDISTLHLVLSQLDGWKIELQSSIESDSMIDINDLLERERRISSTFFDSAGVWNLVVMLGNQKLFHETWNECTIRERADKLQFEITEVLNEIADNIASKSMNQSTATIQYLGKRPSIVNDSLIGTINTGKKINYNDIRNIVSIKLAQSILKKENSQDNHSSAPIQFIHYTPEKEALSVYKSIQQTTFIGGLLQCSGFTTGVLTYLQYLDFHVGGASASMLVLSGILAFPYQINRIQTNYEARLMDFHKEINSSLNKTMQKETDKIHRHLVEGIDPYKRFVETEERRVGTLLTECEDILADAFRLKNKIKKMGYENGESS